MDDVIVIDFEGRIVLGGGSSTLRDAVRDLVVNRQTKILLKFDRRVLHRQLGPRGIGSCLHRSLKLRRPVQDPQSDKTSEGFIADHEAVYDLRYTR